MKAMIKVTYHTPIDTGADKKITECMESVGAKWYAQGAGRDGIRDICFEQVPNQTF